MTRDVAIAWCSPATVSAHFTASIVDVFADDRTRPRIAARLPNLTGPELGVARCDIVRWFLDLGVPWLLQVDSDMVFGPEQVLALLDVADPDTAPIVSGVYAAAASGSNGEAMFGLTAGWLNDDGSENMLAALPDTDDPLLQVDLLGAGFLLVHRTVFEAMSAARPDDPLPWFQYATRRGVAWGEDFEFCARAGDLGIPVHLATRVHVGHHKSLVVWPGPAADAMATGTFEVRAL